jgi:hypothetical protein
VRSQEPEGGHADNSASDLETTVNPYHLSRGTRLFFRFVAVILAASMTALFLRGLINR